MARYHDPMFDPEKRRHPALRFVLLLFVVLVIAAATMNHFNNERVLLVEQNVTVNGLPAALEGFRILHISDLCGIHFGVNQQNLMQAIAGKKFDIVCVTGDITGKNGDGEAFFELIEALPGDIPIYFISGDQDPADVTLDPMADGALAEYITGAQARGAIYLDCPQKKTVGSQTVWICAESLYTYNLEGSERALNARRTELIAEEASDARDAALAAVAYQLDRIERIRAARLQMLSTDTHIALTHYPLSRTALMDFRDAINQLEEKNVGTISLLLAGHYVGGQWRLPGVGAVRVQAPSGLGTNGWFPGDTGVVGLSYSLGITQYISPGLGTSDDAGLPGFRLFNTPTVTILRFTSKLTE